MPGQKGWLGRYILGLRMQRVIILASDFQLSPRQGSHLSRGRSKGPTLACNKQKSKKEALKHLMLGLELLRMNLSSDPCNRQKSKGSNKTSLIGIHTVRGGHRFQRVTSQKAYSRKIDEGLHFSSPPQES